MLRHIQHMLSGYIDLVWSTMRIQLLWRKSMYGDSTQRTHHLCTYCLRQKPSTTVYFKSNQSFEYVYYAHRQNNNKIKQKKRKNKTNFTKHKIISKGNKRIENVIHNTFNCRESSLLDHLLKIQNCINSFENIMVLNTSLTTEFLQNCMLR